MAGCFAAIKAKERGVDVTLVDKGYVSKSGQTPSATCMVVFNPEWGHDLDTWTKEIAVGGEYVNDRNWTELVLSESYARYQDLVCWGVDFLRRPDGALYTCSSWGSGRALIWEERKFASVLRMKAVQAGVRVLDKTMVTTLLKQDGRVSGAIGFGVLSGECYVFLAKAIVISAGTSSFKPVGFPIASQTADGANMAYRAGGELAGEEFIDPTITLAGSPSWYRMSEFLPALVEGEIVFPRVIKADGAAFVLDWCKGVGFEAHAGQAPLLIESRDDPARRAEIVGGATAGMTVPRTAGVCLSNEDCETGLPGVFAAGDSASTMQQGAIYYGLGWNMAGCAVTGDRAGKGAAEHACHAGAVDVDEAEVARGRDEMYAPSRRTGGYSPEWVTQLLQNTMIPYFTLMVKHGERLRAALTLVEFMRDHLVPKLYARDVHELRLAHETASMVLNAEMKLRTSLFRTESRGLHYREDYPRRDDPTWLAWVRIREEDGEMKLRKEPVPTEWWPDLSIPYEVRYPYRFPGE